MKKFITNYWQKILLVIGGIFIAINSFKKIFAKKVLLSDYIKYGKNIENSSISSGTVSNVTENIDTSSMPFNSDMIKVVGFLMIAILFIVFITALSERAGANAKKK